MKKICSAFIILVLVMGLAACDSGNGTGESSRGTESETSVQTPEEDKTKEDADGSGLASDAQEPGESETPVGTDRQKTEGAGETTPEETVGTEAKALVVYFSATGNTKAVAETLAELQGANLYEIVPEQPYTDEDLNYNDRTTRATAEQNDPDARPAIQGSITDFEQYEVVYVGYPIWWGDMPRILYTFFDTYDFGGKTIAPFCTSGGSGLSGTPGTIAELEPGATVLDGLHVSDSAAGSAESSVSQWLADIGQAE